MKLGLVPLQPQVLSSCRSPCTGISCVSAVGNCWYDSFLPILEHGSPGRLLLDKKLPGKNKAEPDQLVKLHFFHKHFDIAGETRFVFSFHPWG